MAAVAANGITIEYDDQGEGEPLVLVMGLGGQLTDWPQDWVDLLIAAGFRVIRHDNRDAGLSTEFPGEPMTWGQLARSVISERFVRADYTLSDMAADTVGLLDALGIESAHIVGASMGGMIAQTVAIEHPHRIRSLVSIMSTTGNRRVGRPKPRVMARFARRRPGNREHALEESLEVFRLVCGPHFDENEFRRLAAASIARSYRPEGTARQAAAIFASGDRTPGLEQLDVPTLVVHGMLDPLVTPSGGMATAAAVPRSRLLMFNDMAHDLPRERWGELIEAIAQNARRAGAPVSV